MVPSAAIFTEQIVARAPGKREHVDHDTRHDGRGQGPEGGVGLVAERPPLHVSRENTCDGYDRDEVSQLRCVAVALIGHRGEADGCKVHDSTEVVEAGGVVHDHWRFGFAGGVARRLVGLLRQRQLILQQLMRKKGGASSGNFLPGSLCECDGMFVTACAFECKGTCLAAGTQERGRRLR